MATKASIEKMVQYTCPPDPTKSTDEPVFVSRNGVDYLIRRGETVTIPEGVRDILEEAHKNRIRLRARLEALAKDM